MNNTPPRPSLASSDCGTKLKSSPINPFYCIQDNQTAPVVKATQAYCVLKHDAGKMTVSSEQQERSIAGRSSKNCNLKQANHHHIKRSDLTDGGKKLSLTGKLKLSDHHDQGMTDFIYLYISCYVHVHKYTHTHIYLLKSHEKIKQSRLWKNKACFLGL